MRFPTTDEFVMGAGITFGITFLVFKPLDLKLEGWQVTALASLTLAIGVMLAMEISDWRRLNRTKTPAMTYQDPEGFVRIFCPEEGCEGRIEVQLPREQDVYVRCPQCRQVLGLGRDRVGRVVGYSDRILGS
jgi:hypothetical protein